MTAIPEILARIELVMSLRGYPSEAAWCRAAKVSRTYIAAMRVRGGPRGTGQVKSVNQEQMAKLAKTAGIELGWLLGEGPREPVRQLLPEPSENNYRKALDEFDWPEGITIDQSLRVKALAAMDAEKPGAVALPVKLWRQRLYEIATEVMSTKSRVVEKRRTSGE
jgi:hypothetical protein